MAPRISSQRYSASYGNGVSTSYGYNAQRAFLTSITTSTGSTSLMALTYTRDFTGRITAVSNSAVTSNVENWTYGYNDLGELTAADNQGDNTQDQTWTYDLVGNMLSNSKVGTYVYPTQGATAVRPHAPISIAGQAVSYDANGNTSSYTVNGQTRTLTFDGKNRPLSIAIAGGATTTFEYGVDGARTKKTAGTDVSWYLGGDTELIVDAINPAGEWGQYLHADVKRTGTTLAWMHKDNLNSNRVVTDAVGGIPANGRTAFASYGKPLTTPLTFVPGGVSEIKLRSLFVCTPAVVRSKRSSLEHIINCHNLQWGHSLHPASIYLPILLCAIRVSCVQFVSRNTA